VGSIDAVNDDRPKTELIMQATVHNANWQALATWMSEEIIDGLVPDLAPTAETGNDVKELCLRTRYFRARRVSRRKLLSDVRDYEQEDSTGSAFASWTLGDRELPFCQLGVELGVTGCEVRVVWLTSECPGPVDVRARLDKSLTAAAAIGDLRTERLLCAPLGTRNRLHFLDFVSLPSDVPSLPPVTFFRRVERDPLRAVGDPPPGDL
jgi:hypothetical protein